MDVCYEDIKREGDLVSERDYLPQIKLFLENIIDELLSDFKKKFKEQVSVLIEKLELSRHLKKDTIKECSSKNVKENEYKKDKHLNNRFNTLNNLNKPNNLNKHNDPLNDSVLNAYIKQVTQYHKNSLIEQLHSNLSDEEISQLFEKTKENEKVIIFNSTKDIDVEKMLPKLAQASETSVLDDKSGKADNKNVSTKIGNNFCMNACDKKFDKMSEGIKQVMGNYKLSERMNIELFEKKCNFNKRIVESIETKRETKNEEGIDENKKKKVELKKEIKMKNSRKPLVGIIKNDETHITDYFPNKKRNIDMQTESKKAPDIYKYCTNEGLKKSDTCEKNQDNKNKLVELFNDERKKESQGRKYQVQIRNIGVEEKQDKNEFLSCDSEEISCDKLKLEESCKKKENAYNKEMYVKCNKTKNNYNNYIPKDDNNYFSKKEKMKIFSEYMSPQKNPEKNAAFAESELHEIKNELREHDKHHQHAEKKCINLFYEVVRGKERKTLKGFDCTDCKFFYEEFLSECSAEEEKKSCKKKKDDNAEKEKLNIVELHKATQKPFEDLHEENKKKGNNLLFFGDTIKKCKKKNTENKYEDETNNEIIRELSQGSDSSIFQRNFKDGEYINDYLDKKQGQNENLEILNKDKECEMEKNMNKVKTEKIQKKTEMMQCFSRHRYHNKVNDSPQNFWGLDFFK